MPCRYDGPPIDYAEKEADAKRREQEAYNQQMAEKVELEKYMKLKAKYENWK